MTKSITNLIADARARRERIASMHAATISTARADVRALRSESSACRALSGLLSGETLNRALLSLNTATDALAVHESHN